MTATNKITCNYLGTLDAPEYAHEIAQLRAAFGPVELTSRSVLRVSTGGLTLEFTDAGFALPGTPPGYCSVTLRDVDGSELATQDRRPGIAGAIATGQAMVDAYWSLTLAAYNQRGTTRYGAR